MQSYKDRMMSLEGKLEHSTLQLEAQHHDSRQRIQARDDLMNEAIRQIREVAQHIQDLAADAKVLSLGTEVASERGRKLSRLLDEIRILGSKARSYL